jgi:Skp family chaperone for outer membrane proteins
MHILLLFLLYFPATIFAQENSAVQSLEPINVDGYVTEQKAVDPELESIKAEITKQKQETVLNKKKAHGFRELAKSVEKLSETTEEYLEEKRAAKDQIAEYNTKVKCLQSEVPGPECDKFVKRR